jgi:hypothetical protein
MSLFAGMPIEELRAFGLVRGEVAPKEGAVYRVPLAAGGAVEVKFTKSVATLGGLVEGEPSAAEVCEVIDVLSGLEVSDG